jgi:hypothetical protein
MAAKRHKMHKMKRGSQNRPHPSGGGACQRKALFFVLFAFFRGQLFFLGYGGSQGEGPTRHCWRFGDLELGAWDFFGPWSLGIGN